MAATAPRNMDQQNLLFRKLLLETSPRNQKLLGSFDLVNGGDTRIRLANVGITTGLFVRIYGTYTIGTAAATVSDAAPFNVLRRVQLADYDGSTRVDASGHHLWAINSIRQRSPYGFNNYAKAPVYLSPNLPVGVGAQAFEYYFEVPLALQAEQDLTGAILSQTGVGDLFLTLSTASTAQWLDNGNADAVFRGGATSTISGITVKADVYQNFLVARDLGNGVVPLPQLDLLSVYEIRGSLRTSANLASNTGTVLDVPNVRKVIGCTMSYLNQGVYLETDLEALKLVVNSTNVLWDARGYAQYQDQRNWVGCDLGRALYFLPYLRRHPIQTALIGNTQIVFTPSASTPSANTWLERTFESVYAKGVSLPGVASGV